MSSLTTFSLSVDSLSRVTRSRTSDLKSSNSCHRTYIILSHCEWLKLSSRSCTELHSVNIVQHWLNTINAIILVNATWTNQLPRSFGNVKVPRDHQPRHIIHINLREWSRTLDGYLEKTLNQFWFQVWSFYWSVFKNTVGYWTFRNSHVFTWFVDFNEAFDNVDYWLLFWKMYDVFYDRKYNVSYDW